MAHPISYFLVLQLLLRNQADEVAFLQQSKKLTAKVAPHKVLRPLSLLAMNSTLSREDASVNIWPMPKTVTHGQHSATVSSKLKFVGDTHSPLVTKMIERYKDLLFPHADVVDGNIQEVSVALGSGTGESYSLTVSPERVEIHADAAAGVQYALETLSQLVAFDFDKALYVTQPVLPLTISDEPRYQHRGLLIDSSRHFLPVKAIKRLIRSISYAKLNRLHWHITDAQSFPIHSRVEPLLASKGAWSQRERYTMDDVREIVDYAKDHSILVVPEFDMPGHTTSWGKAHPEVMSLTEDRFNDGNTGALNPLKEESFKLVESLLKDWLSASDKNTPFFDGGLVHLGTDEVPYAAWQGLGDSNAMFSAFVDRITGYAQNLGKEVVLWEEAIKDGAPAKEAIVQVWLDSKMAQRAADHGNRVILSQGWYLDHLDDTWENMYRRDPVTLVQGDQTHLMIGGEGCMWGETVDGGDLEQTVWPRLGAIAERLWSPEGDDVDEAKPRLESFRCLLLERGIASGTVEGHGRSTPSGPGSCSTQ